jgi:predicted dehydrogenase
MAIRARSERRTETVALERGVGPVVSSYGEVLADLDVQMGYKPLPNALRGPWNLAAVRAGKQELSEKLFPSDADEADEVRDAGRWAGATIVGAPCSPPGDAAADCVARRRRVP